MWVCDSRKDVSGYSTSEKVHLETLLSNINKFPVKVLKVKVNVYKGVFSNKRSFIRKVHGKQEGVIVRMLKIYNEGELKVCLNVDSEQVYKSLLGGEHLTVL